MSNCSKALGKIIQWLKQGSPNSKKLIDFPWEVEEENGVYKAVNPMFPISIYISCDDVIGVVRLQTPLDFETITMSKNERLLLYYKLLRLSIAPMIKYVLVGDEAVPTIVVDLSVKTLGKNEFNDALAMHLAAINAIIRELGLEEKYKSKLFLELLSLVKKHLEEGWGREKLVEYLVKYARINKEQAKEIIEALLKEVVGRSESNIYA
ncbi:conserved hypothetical protein [Staphylothermus marinus F1]|uniref:Uncharacterized protein n=1 Tax=Staphylothermus marinus (strain ATCC 43588 / DSM 3639 / JCM 9404 / F1) TaxID=399550 RepID=A3DLN7_STAMF|nr:hypothetical protein [Staphylothermus marinus]ABN69547.1 conserved hypothetical protein [Staphylothermus marinus F1]